jgi:hypothetical protein
VKFLFFIKDQGEVVPAKHIRGIFKLHLKRLKLILSLFVSKTVVAAFPPRKALAFFGYDKGMVFARGNVDAAEIL